MKLTSIQDTALEKQPKTDTLTKSMLDRLPQLLAPHVKLLSIGSVVIHDGKMALTAINPKGTTYQQADSIDWFLSGLKIDPADTTETGKALYANNILLTTTTMNFTRRAILMAIVFSWRR